MWWWTVRASSWSTKWISVSFLVLVEICKIILSSRVLWIAPRSCFKHRKWFFFSFECVNLHGVQPLFSHSIAYAKKTDTTTNAKWVFRLLCTLNQDLVHLLITIERWLLPFSWGVWKIRIISTVGTYLFKCSLSSTSRLRLLPFWRHGELNVSILITKYTK